MRRSQSQNHALFDRLAQGLPGEVPAAGTVRVGGKSWRLASLLKVLRAPAATARAIDMGEAKIAAQRRRYQKELAAALLLRNQLATFGQVNWGKGDARLAIMGLPTGRRRKSTAEVNALAAAKRRQSRQVKHTMGKRQRQQVSANPGPRLVVVGPDGNPLPPPGKPGSKK